MADVSLSYVHQLNSGRDLWNMKARVIKVWKQSYRLDVILIDETGAKIQGIIKNHLLPQFEEKIKEDSVVLIKKFGVGVQTDLYKVINLGYKVNFFKSTEVVSTSGFTGHPYGFQFIPFTDINGNNLPEETLTVDVIGRLSWCGDLEIFKKNGKESKRILAHLEDFEGNVLKCTMWASYAEQFNTFVAANQDNYEHKIIVIQHGKVKPWAGEITVQNDMYATRVFMNEDLTEVNQLRKSLILRDGPSTSTTVLSSQTSYPLHDEFVLNTPMRHVDEIGEIDEEMSCIVVATIRSVEEEFGWFYKAHRKCNRKVVTKSEYLEHASEIPSNFLEAPFDSLWCLKCKCMAESLIPKFKLQIRVQDSTGSTSFVLFDKDVVKVVGDSATDIRDKQVDDGDIVAFSNQLSVLINKILAFKISISKYNLEHRTYPVYTVSKICDDPDVIDQLKQAGNQEQLTPGEFASDTINLDDSSQQAVDSKDCASVTGSCLHLEVDKDSATTPAVKQAIPFDLEDKLLEHESASRSVKKFKS